MEPSWIIVIAAVLALGGGGVAALVLRRPRGRRRPSREVASPAMPGPRLRARLTATRRRLGGGLEAALGRAVGGADVALAEIEEALVAADVGVRTASELVARVRARVGQTADRAGLCAALREELEAALGSSGGRCLRRDRGVILVTGVNGVGKTTTIGKLAARHAAAGRSSSWSRPTRSRRRDRAARHMGRADRRGARSADCGREPGGVAFDGIKAAVAREVDIVLVDTAGRLHTRSNLLEELAKVRRVVARELPGAPHETLLVLDATTGQNAVAQARTFTEAVGVTGVVLTKLDGTAKGGVAIAVRREIGAPLRYVGIGEGVEDLRPFDAHEFVEALLDGEAPGSRHP
jgi:fused signal recognition particle receptor